MLIRTSGCTQNTAASVARHDSPRELADPLHAQGMPRCSVQSTQSTLQCPGLLHTWPHACHRVTTVPRLLARRLRARSVPFLPTNPCRHTLSRNVTNNAHCYMGCSLFKT